MTGWLIEPGAIPLDEFAEYRASAWEEGAEYSYWGHMASWLRQRENPDVLLVTFEDMKRDLRGVVERVAGFIGVDDDISIETAVEHSSFEFMSTHREPFSEPWTRRHTARLFGIPVESEASKVRRGTVGQNRLELSSETRRRLDAIWDQTIGDEFGLTSYEQLLDELGGEARSHPLHDRRPVH